MGLLFGKLLRVDFGLQLIGWIISAKFRTEKFYDVTGSLTFILLTYLSRKESRQTLRQNIQSACVMIWALRLGTYLFRRILTMGKDPRFDRMRNSPLRLLVPWFLQGVWVIVTLLPTLYLNQTQVDKALTKTDFLGWGMWLFGFLFEAFADRQKTAFKNDPKNKGKFLDTGLWKYSRHPNYFGEICAWIGLYISSSHMLSGYERYTGLLSPALVTFLLSFVSGVPLLEKQAMKAFGSDTAYRAYRNRTPVLIPFINFPRI